MDADSAELKELRVRRLTGVAPHGDTVDGTKVEELHEYVAEIERLRGLLREVRELLADRQFITVPGDDGYGDDYNDEDVIEMWERLAEFGPPRPSLRGVTVELTLPPGGIEAIMGPLPRAALAGIVNPDFAG